MKREKILSLGSNCVRCKIRNISKFNTYVNNITTGKHTLLCFIDICVLSKGKLLTHNFSTQNHNLRRMCCIKYGR